MAAVATTRTVRRPFRRAVARSRPAAFGLVLVGAVVLVAFVGPLLAPHDPAGLISAPFTRPSSSLPLGADYLGRDALSRFLWGGRALLIMALLATLLAYLVGGTIGMFAALRRGRSDALLMGVLDVALAFPPLIFVLVLLSVIGPQLWLVVIGVSVIFVPRVARIVRGAALDVVAQEFVEAAVARAETTPGILYREILPNIWPTVLADCGIRFSGAIILIASLSFLGFGQQPPSADWGLLISENRDAFLVQPWVVVAPCVAIALLTIGVNLVADAVSRSLGRSGVGEAGTVH